VNSSIALQVRVEGTLAVGWRVHTPEPGVEFGAVLVLRAVDRGCRGILECTVHAPRRFARCHRTGRRLVRPQHDEARVRRSLTRVAFGTLRAWIWNPTFGRCEPAITSSATRGANTRASSRCILWRPIAHGGPRNPSGTRRRRSPPTDLRDATSRLSARVPSIAAAPSSA